MAIIHNSMKLYATTISERASKGQGGNKHIIIELQRDRTKLSHVIEYTMDGLRVSAMTDDGGVVVYEEGAHVVPCKKCGGRRDVEALTCNSCTPTRRCRDCNEEIPEGQVCKLYCKRHILRHILDKSEKCDAIGCKGSALFVVDSLGQRFNACKLHAINTKIIECKGEKQKSEDQKTCDHCGSADGFNNSSDEFQCNNCGHSEGE